MDELIAKILREPFPPDYIGKLPRVWCKACRDAQFKVCKDHTKRKCRDCGNNVTDAHLHLDYVGHAEVTDRLLQADPTWTWEPVAFGQDGLPLVDRQGGLWIRLTVAGVTRLGYGHADGKPGPDAVKEAIGDALRNSAMRFGVALDLWGAKFKDDADNHDEQSQDPEDWEQAEKPPTDAQAKLFEDYAGRVTKAESEQVIANVGQLVKDARGNERLTRTQYGRLSKLAAEKLAELRGAT